MMLLNWEVLNATATRGAWGGVMKFTFKMRGGNVSHESVVCSTALLLTVGNVERIEMLSSQQSRWQIPIYLCESQGRWKWIKGLPSVVCFSFFFLLSGTLALLLVLSGLHMPCGSWYILSPDKQLNCEVAVRKYSAQIAVQCWSRMLNEVVSWMRICIFLLNK